MNVLDWCLCFGTPIISKTLNRYSSLVRNNSQGPLLPHGPWDSPNLHGKVWVVEDDSRTSLASDQRLKFSTDAEQDANLMRRNVLTSVLRGNALYFYDLGSAGWFGRPDRATETASIWRGIGSAASIYRRDAARAGAAAVNLQSQVAVFVDDVSAATRTVFDEGSPFLSSLLRSPSIYLASIGAPTRVFLLSDLLLPSYDWRKYRMCVFLNAFVVTPTLSRAIDVKLRRHNTTLVWTYAAGIFADALGERRMNMTRISQLVGVPLKPGNRSISIMTHVPRSPTLGVGFPRDYGLPSQAPDPFFELDRHSPSADAVEVLGTLKADLTNQTALLLRARHNGWTSVFSASPGLPVQLWRSLAATAGVHLYLPHSEEICVHGLSSWQVGDAVEVAGTFLLVHASAVCSAAGEAAKRVVQLPVEATEVSDEHNATVCRACRSFSTPPMKAGEVLLYNVE
jgi:hypothetical protein